MGAWIVGHNLAGYTPESDVLAFSDYTEALSALVEEMRYYADADDDNAFDSLPADAFDDDQPAMLAQVEAIVRDEIKPGHLTGDVGFILEDNQGRNISFWLQWSADDSADEEV
jgi:hypothetical protein